MEGDGGTPFDRKLREIVEPLISPGLLDVPEVMEAMRLAFQDEVLLELRNEELDARRQRKLHRELLYPLVG